jgi:hypothetical protein
MITSIASKRWPRLVGLRRNRTTKLVGAIVTIVAYFLTAYWLTVSYIPDINFQIGPNVAGKKVLLLRPFSRYFDSDFAVATERYQLFDNLADSDDNNYRSTIQLYENGKRIGPAHSKHLDIAALGRGRFSHWRKNGTTFYWSSSDNSDPNTNGRAYWVVKPEIPDSSSEP